MNSQSAVVVGLAAVVAGVLGAPAAHADTFYPHGDQGDRDIALVRADIATVDQHYGLSMPDDMPTVLCDALDKGSGETAVINLGTAQGIPHAVAAVTVYSAEWHFCPRYY